MPDPDTPAPTAPVPPLLAEVLRTVVRRYPAPALPATPAEARQADPATTLAFAIEQARAAVAGGGAPAAALQPLFVEALARLIGEASRPQGGDPAFQAMVLQHEAPRVREYASLAAHAERDRRAVRAAVNAVAHPAKWARHEAEAPRQALMRLHADAQASAWSALAGTARGLKALPTVADALDRLLADPALLRLLRLEALSDDALVRRYRALQGRRGPASGTPEAAAQGAGAQRRGAAGETLATRALDRLAQRLDEAARAPASFRAVTAMLTPASLAAGAQHAKTEWDVALLGPGARLCLLVEVKASADAATTDYPRMLRGLQCLAGADDEAVYPFATREGRVNLRGSSLRALVSGPAVRPGAVLYCCTGPAEPAPRVLSAASRMQLLSAPVSLAFATRLAANPATTAAELEPVWRQLLESTRFAAVLQQYPTLRTVRGMMVHVDDLSAAIEAAGRHG